MKKIFSLRNMLLSFAFVLVAIFAAGAATAQASSAEPTATPAPKPTLATIVYEPATDTIKAESGTVYVYVLSKADGVTLKPGAKSFAVTTSGVTLEDIGAKSTKKDTYLYVVTAELADQVDSAKPNFTIKAQEAYKVACTIDYTKADDPDSTNVLTVTATDKAKKELTIADAKRLVWCDTIDGKYQDVTTYTGEKLAADIAEAKSKTIYVKLLGTADTMIRSTAPVKVKVAVSKKASSVKIDVKKSTLAIKNGYDFSVVTLKGDVVETATKWFTILPYNKESNQTDAIVETAVYKPMDKKANGAKNAYVEGGTVSYTKTKPKSLSLSDLYKELKADKTKELILGVRKSATIKAPASAVTVCKIAPQAGVPYVVTEMKYANDYVIASPTGKGSTTLVVPELFTHGNFTGFGADLKKSDAAKGEDKPTDEAAAKFEYLVVAAADLDKIDWTNTTWKSMKVGTKFTIDKTKTKYVTVDDKGNTVKKDGTLKKLTSETFEVDKADATSLAAENASVLLIRRAGVKGKTIDTSVQASDYLITYVAKLGSGTDASTKWYTTEPIGEEAFKYTITLEKASGKEEGKVTYTKEGEATVGLVAAEKGKPAAGNKPIEITIPKDHVVVKTVAEGGKYEASEKEGAKDTFTVEADGATLTVQYAKAVTITVKVIRTLDGVESEVKDMSAKIDCLAFQDIEFDWAKYLTDKKLTDHAQAKVGVDNDVTAEKNTNISITTKGQGEGATQHLIVSPTEAADQTITIYLTRETTPPVEFTVKVVKKTADGESPVTALSDGKFECSGLQDTEFIWADYLTENVLDTLPEAENTVDNDQTAEKNTNITYKDGKLMVSPIKGENPTITIYLISETTPDPVVPGV